MKFHVDEDVANTIVARLRADGWVVTLARDLAPGNPDEDVLATAHAMGAVLVTQDKGYGRLVHIDRAAHSGVVLIRLVGLPHDERAERVSRAIRDHAAELVGAFTVIEEAKVRVRKPGPPPPTDPAP